MPKHLDQLAFELLQTFARCEYALKAVGFHNGDGAAEPNWRSFAKSNSNIFDNLGDPELSDAVVYILNHPPKKQMIVDGFLAWREGEPNTNIQTDRVLLYVRRVRNNLFHGGKFNGRWFEPERSELLLRHSLTILHTCLDASPDVNTAYSNH